MVVCTSTAEFFRFDYDQKRDILQRFDKKITDLTEDVKILREWLKKQPHIPRIEDDRFLEIILIKNKFRLEKTKLKIDKYFAMKNLYADMFDAMDIDKLQSLKNELVMCLLPDLTSNHERVHFSSYHTKDFVNVHDLIILILISTDMRLQYDYSPCDIFVFDVKKLSLRLVQNITPSLLSKSAQIFYEAFSGRIAEMHFVNIPTFMDVVMSIMKPVLPKKLMDRIHLHKNYNSLSKMMSLNFIPSDFGGSGPSSDKLFKAHWALLEECRSEQIKRNISKTNERLRVGDPVIVSELYGASGTFKKLNID